MKKKAITHLAVFTAVFLCFALVFGTTSVFAADTRPNETITNIAISNQSGVLEGETLQLKATVNTNSTFFDSVEWSSSNPSVISCTKDGKITGLVAGKSATITCKAKYGRTNDKITVYCVKKLSKQVKSGISNYIALVYSYPNVFFWKDVCFDISSLRNPFSQFFYILFFSASLTSVNTVISDKVTVCGKCGNFAYIRYGENNELDGFVKNIKLKSSGNDFLKLSATNMNVWANGVSYSHRKLTTGYNGNIQWDVEHEDEYLRFNRDTGQITGLVPGKTATITATADGETATCTIHLLYKWPQPWTAKTNRNTNIYYTVGNGYSKGAVLSENTEFVVEGDCGTNDGWAYGYISGTETWGFVPISHISTKGTVSQYNLMDFRWPVNDMNIKKISSPFGPRSSANGGNHKGFDIVANNKGEISGKSVVSSFNGTIRKIYIDNNKETSHGNAIVITTNKADPISDKNLTVIYMHLSKWNTNSSGNIVVDGKVLKEGDSVAKEQIIGCAGNTGYNTSGAHLHYEVNNQNAAIRSGSNNPFTETINPIFFYMNIDDSITKSNDCEAATNGNGFYWYGENE